MPKKLFKKYVLLLLVMITIFLILGTFVFSYLENWHFIDAFYFVVMTATTVGYGDFVPTNGASKVFTIIYALSIVPFVLYLFSLMAKYNVELVSRKISRIEYKQHKQEEELDTAERRIQEQRRRIKNQEKENEKQEREIHKQKREMNRTSQLLDEAEGDIDLIEEVIQEVMGKKKQKGKKKK